MFLNIKRANEEVSRLRDELNASTELVESANGELEARQAIINDLQEANGNLTQQLSDARDRITELEATAQTVEEAAATQAAEMVAAQGVPVAELPEADAKGNVDLVAQYQSLTDPNARALFIKEHGAALLKLSRKQLSNQ